MGTKEKNDGKNSEKKCVRGERGNWKCVMHFPLIYRIKLTLPGVAPQAPTSTVSHRHNLHAVCEAHKHTHPAVWYESRLVPSWYKCLECENSSLGIPTKYPVLVTQ